MRKPETETIAVDLPALEPGGGDTVDIEADTVEEAMAQVAATLGEQAQIIDARKIVSGGIAGLFAKERVVLTARRPPEGLSSILDQMSRDVDAAETEFGVMLRRRLAANHDRSPDELLRPDPVMATERVNPAGAIGTILAADSESYSLTPIETAPVDTALLNTAPLDAAPLNAAPLVAAPPDPAPFDPATLDPAPLGPAPLVASPPQSQPATAAPGAPPLPVALHASPERVVPELFERAHAASSPAPPGAGRVDWGRTELVRHSVPERVIAAVANIDGYDDMTWISAVADAVAPFCTGPLDDDNVVVGAGAVAVGEMLSLERIEPCGIAPYQGGFYSSAAGSYDEQKWLDFVLAGRPLHVVIDDSNTWGDLLVADPYMVSWVDPVGVAPALHLAATLGARLGLCPSTAITGGLVRATPVDVALAVRQLLRRR